MIRQLQNTVSNLFQQHLSNQRSIRKAGFCRIPTWGSVEILEDRNLLSSLPLSTVGADAAMVDVGDVTIDEPIHSDDADVLTDAGDFFIVDGQTKNLLRKTDEWVFHTLGNQGPGTAAIASLNKIDDDVYWGKGDPLDAGVSPFMTAPVFVSPDSGLRLFPSNEVVVKYAGDEPEQFFSSVPGINSMRPLRGTNDQFVATVTMTDGLDSLRIATSLDNMSKVEWAEPNFVTEVVLYHTPNDPLYAVDQWNVNTTVPDLGFEDAWDISRGNGIVIAVFDAGFDLTHPDLANAYWVNTLEATGTVDVDDDTNGWTDDIHGIDAANGGGDPSPETAFDNHGTPVASIAAATGDNAEGISGAAPAASIMAINIVNTDAEGVSTVSPASLVEAIHYASDHGAQIGNHSYGITGNTTVTAAFDDVAQNGRGGLGMINFAASGNDSSATTLSGVAYPANIASVIAVGASTDGDLRWDDSNGGAELDFIAPGADIPAADRAGAAGYLAGDYLVGPGTSLASPLAAGVAALMLAENPALTADEVRTILQDTSEQIGGVTYVNGHHDEYGHGRLNAGAAVFSSTIPIIDEVVAPPAGPSAISWTSIPGATRYRFTLQNLTTGVYVYDESNVAANSYAFPQLDMGRYRSYVQAFNADDVSSMWSTHTDFNVGPELQSPVNITSIDQRPTFTWDAIQGAVEYRIYVSVPTQPNYDERNIFGTEWTPPADLPDVGGAIYRWWILPYNAAGQSGAWSDSADFMILRPNITSVSSSSTPTINWWQVPAATSFNIQVRNSSNAIVFTGTSTTESAQVTNTLPADTYRVWVQAISASSSLWSKEYVFTVASLEDSSDQAADSMFAEFPGLQLDALGQHNGTDSQLKIPAELQWAGPGNDENIHERGRHAFKPFVNHKFVGPAPDGVVDVTQQEGDVLSKFWSERVLEPGLVEDFGRSRQNITKRINQALFR